MRNSMRILFFRSLVHTKGKGFARSQENFLLYDVVVTVP